ncbi:FAD-binding protein, partial [Salmonella enterica subsp. enterica serovar Anatum]|nr:FAD-binding protein [Salmonella enterica subsp. enterica serovar Anatum]
MSAMQGENRLSRSISVTNISLALRLAEKHKVIVLSKGPVSEGSTFYAQGGIAAVFDETDS